MSLDDTDRLGVCPECQAQEIAESEAKPDEQKRLFA